jgi:hypothetical protein
MKNIFLLISCAMSYTSYSQLQLSSGLSWKSSPSTYIVLDNLGLKHDATSSSLDNVFKFTGGADVAISGTTLPSFSTIQLAKTGSSKLILQRSISANLISFQSGLIDLNGNNIDLGTTGQLSNETEASHIIGPNGGYVQIVNTLNAPNSSNAGNLGAIISSSQNLGSTTIRRGHLSQMNGSSRGNSILRYFDITPTNNTSLNATLRFVYLDAELNGLDENSLVLWKSDNLTTWINQGYNTKDNQFNYVEKTAINNFSRWTLSTPNNPLPLLWNSFNTQCLNNHVLISWKTFSEHNTRSFVIQKSNDGTVWTDLSSVAAAGNSSTVLNYSYSDVQPSGTAFYRVAQLDLDGHKLFSPVLHSICGGNDVLTVYPNPASSQAWISLQWQSVKNIHILIYDAKGALLRTQNETLQAGTNTFSIDLSKYASGNYTIVITNESGKMKIAKMEKK